jgi:hypothetical protein
MVSERYLMGMFNTHNTIIFDYLSLNLLILGRHYPILEKKR